MCIHLINRCPALADCGRETDDVIHVNPCKKWVKHLKRQVGECQTQDEFEELLRACPRAEDDYDQDWRSICDAKDCQWNPDTTYMVAVESMEDFMLAVDWAHQHNPDVELKTCWTRLSLRWFQRDGHENVVPGLMKAVYVGNTQVPLPARDEDSVQNTAVFGQPVKLCGPIDLEQFEGFQEKDPKYGCPFVILVKLNDHGFDEGKYKEEKSAERRHDADVDIEEMLLSSIVDTGDGDTDEEEESSTSSEDMDDDDDEDDEVIEIGAVALPPQPQSRIIKIKVPEPRQTIKGHRRRRSAPALVSEERAIFAGGSIKPLPPLPELYRKKPEPETPPAFDPLFVKIILDQYDEYESDTSDTDGDLPREKRAKRYRHNKHIHLASKCRYSTTGIGPSYNLDSPRRDNPASRKSSPEAELVSSLMLEHEAAWDSTRSERTLANLDRLGKPPFQTNGFPGNLSLEPGGLRMPRWRLFHRPVGQINFPSIGAPRQPGSSLPTHAIEEVLDAANQSCILLHLIWAQSLEQSPRPPTTYVLPTTPPASFGYNKDTSIEIDPSWVFPDLSGDLTVRELMAIPWPENFGGVSKPPKARRGRKRKRPLPPPVVQKGPVLGPIRPSVPFPKAPVMTHLPPPRGPVEFHQSGPSIPTGGPPVGKLQGLYQPVYRPARQHPPRQVYRPSVPQSPRTAMPAMGQYGLAQLQYAIMQQQQQPHFPAPPTQLQYAPLQQPRQPLVITAPPAQHQHEPVQEQQQEQQQQQQPQPQPQPHTPARPARRVRNSRHSGRRAANAAAASPSRRGSRSPQTIKDQKVLKRVRKAEKDDGSFRAASAKRRRADDGASAGETPVLRRSSRRSQNSTAIRGGDAVDAGSGAQQLALGESEGE